MNQVTLADIGKDLSSVMKDVDVFPLVKYYIEQLKIDQILAMAIPTHPESIVSNAQTLCVMIANIVIAKHPLYKIEQWVSKYFDGRAVEQSDESVEYNDDRCGRVLDKLFLANRNTLLTQISAKAIEVHQLELSQINNDYRLYEDVITSEGYRIIWIHSDNKAQQDVATRKRRIDKALTQLIELKPKLNKRQLKTMAQIQAEVKKINRHGFFTVVITEHQNVYKKQVFPGKPTVNTEYKEVEDITYSLSWEQDQDAITRDISTDGIFPLINNTIETKTQVLQRYKTQPFLEKRFQTSKSVLEIAPVFLKKPERIEAMTFLYFIALMIVSLIERNIRKPLKETPTELKILPGKRNATAPTWSNIKEFFSDLHLSFIKYKQQVASPKLCGLSQLHQKILKLLKVPIELYAELQDNWWKFNLAG